jgi:hypothetical protein
MPPGERRPAPSRPTEPGERFLLDQMTTPLGTAPNNTLTYAYDGYGRVSTRTDVASGLTWSVGYDQYSGRVKSKDVAVTGVPGWPASSGDSTPWATSPPRPARPA